MGIPSRIQAKMHTWTINKDRILFSLHQESVHNTAFKKRKHTLKGSWSQLSLSSIEGCDLSFLYDISPGSNAAGYNESASNVLNETLLIMRLVIKNGYIAQLHPKYHNKDH